MFEQPAVVALTPTQGRSEIPRNLSALARKELIRADRSALTPWETFRFRHMLIRDAAYERLPKSERAELHEMFADWLAGTLGDRRAEGRRDHRLPPRTGVSLSRGAGAGRRARAGAGPPSSAAAHHRRRTGAREIRCRRDREPLRPRGEAAGSQTIPSVSRSCLSLVARTSENGSFDDAKATFTEAIERAHGTGDERLIAHARVMRYLVLDADLSAVEIPKIADDGMATFERAGDEKGLCLAWRLRGEASWLDGSIAGDEEAKVRALEHARRAGSHWEEAVIVRQMSIDFYWGPTPVTEAIRWCEAILARAPDDRGFEGGSRPCSRPHACTPGQFRPCPIARQALHRDRD